MDWGGGKGKRTNEERDWEKGSAGGVGMGIERKWKSFAFIFSFARATFLSPPLLSLVPKNFIISGRPLFAPIFFPSLHSLFVSRLTCCSLSFFNYRSFFFVHSYFLIAPFLLPLLISCPSPFVSPSPAFLSLSPPFLLSSLCVTQKLGSINIALVYLVRSGAEWWCTWGLVFLLE